MKFSTRTTYGLRAMIKLAKNSQKISISLSSIARDENISQKYLERLFAKLKKANLVIAEKGAAGGYCLARNPSQITVYDIIKTLEGNIAPFYCLSEDGDLYCKVKSSCGAVKVLAKVQQAINSTLKSIKLSNLI
jgi:Rrf2 family protein